MDVRQGAPTSSKPQPQQSSKAVISNKRPRNLLRQIATVRRTVFPSASIGGSPAGDFRLYNAADPFPPRVRIELTHEFATTLTSGAAGYTIGTAAPVINLNGLFQPTTAATHQPYGWDQLTPLYKCAKALSCVVTADVTNGNATDDTYIVAQVSSSLAAATTIVGDTITGVAERPMVSVKHMPNGGQRKVSIKMDIPLHVIEGISKLQFDSDFSNYFATSAANPTRIPTLTIASCSSAGGTASTALIRTVWLVEMYERFSQAQS